MSQPNGRRDWEKMGEWTLGELSYVSTEPLDQWKRDAATAEIARRVSQAQIDATLWMKWSFIVLAATSVVSMVAQLGAWLWPHPLP